jgi:hypothetical protein
LRNEKRLAELWAKAYATVSRTSDALVFRVSSIQDAARVHTVDLRGPHGGTCDCPWFVKEIEPRWRRGEATKIPCGHIIRVHRYLVEKWVAQIIEKQKGKA